MRTMRIALLTGLLALTGAAGVPAAAAVPTAQTVTSIPSVGPLFFPSLLGLGPALGLPHTCSASVVHSAGRNLVLTAAHCVFGTGLGFEFAPGFHDGVSPYGVWTVQRVYVDPAWTASQDPQHDVAVLQVGPRSGQQLEDRTGAARLGVAPATGTPVTVDGYVAGSGGRPITCTGPVYYTAGFPSFDCAGYAAGVSGGPWLTGNHVVGVVGGLHQGGCTDSTSYSPAFGADVTALLARAESGAGGDVAPLPGSDGC
ncbi:MAG: serine protease [Jatrophihabitans sp.]|uniref:trypsin-like serine peptidase n=1 Tax=Jatrophihabitans sp. TaxID=1932789 RepID=UPI00391539BE